MAAANRGWPAEAHESLLLCFIEEAVERSDNKKSLIQGVTERMKQAGYKYSYDAINQHVQKLRKSRDTSAVTGNSNGSVATPSKPTPKKHPGQSSGRKRAAPGGSVKSKRVKDEPMNEGDQDDESEFHKMILKQEITSDAEPDTPTKPTKRARKTPTPVTEEGNAGADIEGEC